MSNKLDRPVTTGIEAKASCFRRPLIMGALFATLGGLTGCSSVPDAVNPAEWYKSTVDFFAGEDSQGQVKEESQPRTEEGKQAVSEEKPFPKLSSVPERSSAPVQGGLIADTQNRKYAQAIPRQGEASELLAAQAPAQPPAPSATPSAPSVVTPVQPAPPAMPATAVAQESMPSAAVMPTSSSPDFAPIKPKSISLTPPPSSPTMPANSMASMQADPYGTIVVSSNGVQMQGSAAPVPVRAAQPAATLAVAPVSAVPSLQRQSQGVINGTKVATILFENGSAGLSGHDRRILNEVVRLHKQRGGTVKVVGHASSRTRNMDPVTHKMVNYSLSADRAGKIADELRDMGMDAASVVVDARSDSMPLYYESMPSGEAGNRRAEIYFEN